MKERLWTRIAEHIGQATGRPFAIEDSRSQGGGSINSAFLVSGGGDSYFVKFNQAARLDMFEAEAEGLAELAAPGVIRVPRPVCHGVAAGQAYLVIEAVGTGRGGRDAMRRFGRQLAELHRCRRGRFGWHRDNTIGATPQRNPATPDWVEFYREHRLRFQFGLAARQGYPRLRERGERLLEALEVFFSGYRPGPSLLHGDLWSGNYAIDENDMPVIFDPAVYYGDREADLAMTELFGGFGRDFHDAYREAWPLDPGYAVRKTLYNLYHIVNHVNMFGGGYQAQAEAMLDRLLAEI